MKPENFHIMPEKHLKINHPSGAKEVTVIFTAELTRPQPMNILVYTDGSHDEDDNVRVFANRFVEHGEELGDDLELFPLDEDGFSIVETILNNVRNMIKSHEL